MQRQSEWKLIGLSLFGLDDIQIEISMDQSESKLYRTFVFNSPLYLKWDWSILKLKLIEIDKN